MLVDFIVFDSKTETRDIFQIQIEHPLRKDDEVIFSSNLMPEHISKKDYVQKVIHKGMIISVVTKVRHTLKGIGAPIASQRISYELKLLNHFSNIPI